MSIRKHGSSEDQRVHTEDQEQPQGIHKAAVQTGQQELTPEERAEIIRGEG